MSSSVTTAPTSNARVYCEPFVYTSMVTKMGSTNGYRMVASGEKLGRQALEAVNDMSQRMVLLTQAVDATHELFAYFTTGGAVPLVVFLRCTANLDWQGRPGGFCSGLAFRRDELTQLPGGNAHALDFSALPFLTQDQIVSFLKSAGEQGRDGLLLKGLNLKPVPGYFRPGDRQHLAAHLPHYLGLARRLEAGEPLHGRKDEDTWRTLRLVSLVLPATLRMETSALLGARRGLERVARVQIWLEGDRPGAGISTLLANGSAADGDAAFAAYLGEALSDPAVSDDQILAMLAADPAIESVSEFWTDVRQSQQRNELLRSRSLKGRAAAETAATFASLLRRAPDRPAFVAERLEAWLQEPEPLAACLQMLRVSHSKAYEMAAEAYAEAVKADPGTNLRAALAKPAIWKTPVLRDFWLRAWSDVTLPEPDEAMIVRLLELDDTACRAWLERWVPQHPAAFLHSAAFRASALWETLSPEVRRTLYRSCLEAADPELRVLAVKKTALSDFVEPGDLEFLDGGAFGDARGFVHRFESRRTPADLFALWQSAAARAGFAELAKQALWALVDVLPDLAPEARLAVLRAVREDPSPRGGGHTLHSRALTMVERLRGADERAYEEARRELLGAEAAPVARDAAPVEERKDWSETVAPSRPRGKPWLIIAAVAGVAALGVGGWFFLGKAPAKNPYLAEQEFEEFKASQR